VVTLVVELGRVDEPVLQDGEWQQQQQDVRGGGGGDEEHEEEEQPAFGAEERGHAEERPLSQITQTYELARQITQNLALSASDNAELGVISRVDFFY
jgi:hypothetical protein